MKTHHSQNESEKGSQGDTTSSGEEHNFSVACESYSGEEEEFLSQAAAGFAAVDSGMVRRGPRQGGPDETYRVKYFHPTVKTAKGESLNMAWIVTFKHEHFVCHPQQRQQQQLGSNRANRGSSDGDSGDKDHDPPPPFPGDGNDEGGFLVQETIVYSVEKSIGDRTFISEALKLADRDVRLLQNHTPYPGDTPENFLEDWGRLWRPSALAARNPSLSPDMLVKEAMGVKDLDLSSLHFNSYGPRRPKRQITDGWEEVDVKWKIVCPKKEVTAGSVVAGTGAENVSWSSEVAGHSSGVDMNRQSQANGRADGPSRDSTMFEDATKLDASTKPIACEKEALTNLRKIHI